jgi:hypothetical protein
VIARLNEVAKTGITMREVASLRIRAAEAASDTSSSADEKAANLKMAEREDWTLFRSVDGLTQKAGVPAQRLRRLVLKEIADNGLDEGSKISVGEIDADTFFIEDDGPGFDGTPEEIAALFSIRRPMRSSKLLRLPQRGALGNGLRVVAGAVLASEGSLTVVTRNQRIKLRPESDGTTTVVKVTKTKQPVGTRIEIRFGKTLPDDDDALAWARAAQSMACGETYQGKTSPWWYDQVQFHELLLAYGTQPLRGLIAQLDGCSGGKAGEIVAAAKLGRASCADVDRKHATTLLEMTRQYTRPVSPERLGCVGREAFLSRHYAVAQGTVPLGSGEPQAHIPVVAEAWAVKLDNHGTQWLNIFVNRTPVTGEIEVYRDSADKQITVFGCGLGHGFPDGPTKGAYEIVLNVLTPYCPITSDGKAPDLEPFLKLISDAVTKALRKAQRASPTERNVSQKDVVLENLDDAIASASGDGEYRFNERQIYYQLRPLVLEKTGTPLQIGNFKSILTDYENDFGEIEGMYREPRGSIYHPHRGETIPLGTLTVEEYERPIWTFNKILYIEKEGFSEALKDDGWAERHDCALMSSKGFSTRAARDLIDKLAEHDEPITIFCVHDADAFGTMIYETLQHETRARGARKVTIVNLGLEPWEAVAMELDVENVEASDKRKAVADYVLEREDGESWGEWLQTHRVELNAMTTPQFIAWLDDKMKKHGGGKLIPPLSVVADELERDLEAKVRERLTERILREGKLDKRVAAALKAIKRPSSAALVKGIDNSFRQSPEREWRDAIAVVVRKLLDNAE